MIWTLWSGDFSKEFQYLISCVQCVSTIQPAGFLLLPLTCFKRTLPFLLWDEGDFIWGDGVHIFIFMHLLLKKTYLLNSYYAAGMLYELRPQLRIGKFCGMATLATCLAWVRSDQENTGSVDNVGLG